MTVSVKIISSKMNITEPGVPSLSHYRPLRQAKSVKNCWSRNNRDIKSFESKRTLFDSKIFEHKFPESCWSRVQILSYYHFRARKSLANRFPVKIRLEINADSARPKYSFFDSKYRNMGFRVDDSTSSLKIHDLSNHLNFNLLFFVNFASFCKVVHSSTWISRKKNFLFFSYCSVRAI